MGDQPDYSSFKDYPPHGYADSQNPPSPYADKNSTNPTQSELNIFCKFVQGPYKTDAQILNAVRPPATDKWFPGTPELFKFANSGSGMVEPATDLWTFLCLIYRKKPARINLFTHASDEGQIVLSGKVVDGNVKFGKVVDGNLVQINDIYLTGWELDYAEQATFSDAVSKNITMKMVRQAIPQGAQLFIYACHSGMDLLELKEIEKKLGVKIHGFSNSVLYYPVASYDEQRIDHWKYSVNKGQTWHTNFHDLVADLPR